MDVREFVGTLYVGDRGCKGIHLEAWDGSVRVTVDCISRVRDPSGIWGYYTDEDITDGSIVFTGVDRIELQNDGWIPNDLINSIDVIQDGEVSVVELSIDSVRANAARKETRLRIACTSIHLEDPKRPGIKITA